MFHAFSVVFFHSLSYSYDGLLSVILDVVKLFSLNNYYKRIEVNVIQFETVIFLQMINKLKQC